MTANEKAIVSDRLKRATGETVGKMRKPVWAGLKDLFIDLLDSLTWVFGILFTIAILSMVVAYIMQNGLVNIVASQLSYICQQTGQCDFNFLLTSYGVAQFIAFGIFLTIIALVTEYTDMDISHDDLMDTMTEVQAVTNSLEMETIIIKLAEIEERIDSINRKV